MPKKEKKVKKEKKQLPDKIIPISCSDKEGWSESWLKPKNRNMLNIPHPWRGVFTGPPSSGKSTSIKNIIVRSNPPFEEVIVCHIDPDGSSEWEDCNAQVIAELPEPTSFDRKKKKLLIIEDLNLSQMKKEDKAKLNRLFGYTSTHCNLSVAITCQNAFDLNPSIRRMANLYIVYRQPDLNALITLASRTGLKKQHMIFIMTRLLRNQHDSLWIDLQSYTPANFRINGFTPITLDEIDNAIKEL